MRNLTKEEIDDYLEFTSDPSQDHAVVDDIAQAQLILDASIRCGLMHYLAKVALNRLAEGADSASVLGTIWARAFQMGRECESRLLTQALQGR